MIPVDGWLAAQGGGAMALLAALLLGLRHATDPDHLTAVSTLVLEDRARGTHRASLLGWAWGLGHAATLFAFGLPVILFHRVLPASVTTAAEVLVGVAIVGLAGRLLLRWRRGAFHSHAHRHGELEHAHPHAHELAPREAHAPAHRHAHAESLGRTPWTAFAMGLLHGAGGSAAIGALMVGAASGRGAGVAALALFALGTALSMALVTMAVGQALSRGAAARRVESWVPSLALAGMLFGAWYTLAALQ